MVRVLNLKFNREIITELSKKYDLDKRVVEYIINHFFRFVKDIISDALNLRPIRIRYLGILAIREGQKKK